MEREKAVFQQVLLKTEWNEQAITAFFHFLASEQAKEKELETLLQELYLVGSPTYQRLLNWSGFPPLETIRLIYTHLGAFLDKNGMLQLQGSHKIDTQLSPDSLFFEKISLIVKKAYPKGLVDAYENISSEELKMVHQLRHFIDLQNIFYVRKNFSGATDYEKLLAYEKASKQKLRYRSASRFHNRISSSETWLLQYNDKITTQNGLSEFIVDIRTGAFVSQWNQLKDIHGIPLLIEKDGKLHSINRELIESSPKAYQLSGESGKEIANTESFNYDAGKCFDLLKKHHKYDMRPGGEQKLDSNLRKAAKRNWRFPKQYREVVKRKRNLEDLLHVKENDDRKNSTSK